MLEIESCQFSHRYSKKDFNPYKQKHCDQCDSESDRTYYCEFCGKNFCSKCTLKQAHEEYYSKFTQIVGCEQIHISTDENQEPGHDSIMNVDDVEVIVEVDKQDNTEYCQCGKSNHIENFKCIDCEKSSVRIVQLVQ